MKKTTMAVLVFLLVIVGLLYFLGQVPPVRPTAKPAPSTQAPAVANNSFRGEKGENVVLEDGELRLKASVFDDNQARFYNVEIDGKTIYFFVVKDKKGVYRAAANACQVCFAVKKGFHQEGDFIVCNNCGNRYPLEKIATEKGGCNPLPISPNLEVRNGDLIIKKSDLQAVAEFF